MPSRERLLRELIELRKPLSDISEELGRFPWDCDDELVRLTEADVAAALQKFLNGEISNNDVSQWADLIEGRDDIDYDGLSDIIFRLSTPEINEPLDASVASEILLLLRGK